MHAVELPKNHVFHEFWDHKLAIPREDDERLVPCCITEKQKP